MNRQLIPLPGGVGKTPWVEEMQLEVQVDEGSRTLEAERPSRDEQTLPLKSYSKCCSAHIVRKLPQA